MDRFRSLKGSQENAMKNILMIGPDLQAMGGIATVEEAILNAIRPEDANVQLVATFQGGSKSKKIRTVVSALAKYSKLISGFDLVHVHVASRGSFKRKKIFIDIALKKKIPVLLHLHGSEFGKWFDTECNDSQRSKIRRVFNSCERIIVLSEEWQNYLLDRNICDEKKIVVMHNAVPLPSAPVDVCVSQDVLFLGRLSARKSPDVLLRAARVVLKDHPHVRFRFCGDGDVAKYQALAEELGIASSCDFVGWTTGEKKEEAIRASRIYCLPSKYEGMPMSVLEAMSYGLVAIATPVGGVPQVIQDGINGYLIPTDDSECLANRINELLDASDLAVRIGSAGRKTIEESFNMDSYARKLTEIYESVAGNSRLSDDVD